MQIAQRLASTHEQQLAAQAHVVVAEGKTSTVVNLFPTYIGVFWMQHIAL